MYRKEWRVGWGGGRSGISVPRGGRGGSEEEQESSATTAMGGREGAGERTEALFFRLVAELGSEVG
jgi:hypothetical protein